MAPGSSTKSRVIKLRDSETVRFLDLYASEQVLYDASVEDYRDRGVRMAAAKRISNALKIPGFGPREVLSKFKNLRNSYCQELKKIADSERSGASADDLYRPKVFWYEQMHSFIRPFVQQRQTQSNLVLEESPQEQPELEQSQPPSQHHALNDLSETTSCTSQIKVEAKTPRSRFKRKMPSTVSQPSTSKIKKTLHEPQTDIMSGAIEKLEELSNRAALVRKEDIYDCFGKYVASMLRSIGPPTAMRLQETITSVIVKAMCPPSTPSNHSTQSISGSESNMSDFSDEYFFTDS